MAMDPMRVGVFCGVLASVGCVQAIPTPAMRPPSVTASQRPATATASPQTGVSPPAASAAALPATGANPFGLPRFVGPALPVALRALLGAQGASARLIGQDGTSMIGQDGTSYRLAATEASTSRMLGVNTGIMMATTSLIDDILHAVTNAMPVPGRLYTGPDGKKPGQFITFRLDVLPDHALVSIWRGQTPDPARQMIGIAITSPTKGRAVFYGPDDVRPDKVSRFALAFDHDAGRITADGRGEKGSADDEGGPERFTGRWEYQFLPAATPGATAFKLRSTFTNHKLGEPGTPSTASFAANFDTVTGGAYWIGISNGATGGTRIFFPADGISPGAMPSPPHDLFVDADGHDLPRTSAGSLAALLPPDDEAVLPAPADPGLPGDGAVFMEAPGLEFPD